MAGQQAEKATGPRSWLITFLSNIGSREGGEGEKERERTGNGNKL